jgi:hypothetical protein
VTIVACREDGRILQGEIEINLSISSRLTERESERMEEKEEEENGGKKVHFVLNVGVMFARSVSNAHSSSSVNIGPAAAPARVYLNTALYVLFVHGRVKYLAQRRRTSVLEIKRKVKENGMNGEKDTQQMQQHALRENGREEKVLHSYLMPEGINRQLCHTLKSGASVLSHSIAQLSCNSLASSSLFFSLRQPLENLLFSISFFARPGCV